jgi:enoyl-CoA hydratase/carnithine racemase
VGARIYDPEAALDAGFLDAVVPPERVLEATLEEAERWAALPRPAYAGQVKMNRGPRIAALEAAVQADHDLVFDVP